MESFLRSLTQAENTALFRVGLDGIITYSHGEIVERFLGLTEPFLGTSFHEAFAEVPGPISMLPKAVLGETVSTTDWYRGRLLELQLFPERSETGKIVGVFGIAHDLTTASLTLGSKENQYLLDTVFENNQDGIMVIDENFVVRRVNKAFRNWLPEVIPDQCTCFGSLVGIPEPCSFCPCKKTFRTGKRYECVYYNPKYDKWYELTSFPVADPETGKTNLVIEYVRDIDEKHRREEYIEHQKNLFDAILEASQDGIIASTEGIDDTHVNASFLHMFEGWDKQLLSRPKEEILQYFDSILLDTDYFLKLAERLRATGKQQDGEIHFRDGRVYRICGRMVHSGLGKTGKTRIWTFRDMTQQLKDEQTLEEYHEHLEKKVEERTRELRRKDSQMQVLLSNSNSPIFFTDTDFHFTFVNAAFLELTGYSEMELIDRPLATIWDKDLADDSEVQILHRRILTGEIDNYRIEMPIRTKNATIRWVDKNATAVRDPDGKIAQIIVVLLDVTEKQRILEELKAARQAALDASEAKSQFLATMSHEIRTPLNGVIGLSDLLLGTKLEPKQHEYAQLVNDSGKTLLFLINDILDFSKIEAGKLEIDIEEFNLVSTVESVLGILASRAESKGIELGASFAYSLPRFVAGDSGRIRQVLINLVGNAVKFTEQGGVRIELIPDHWEGNTLWIRFNIRDTGIGIPPEKMDRLFKQFSQTDTSSSRIYGGTGLGLAISMRLVHLMGGEIGVKTEIGKGSNFWFTLPLTCRPVMSKCIQEDIRYCLLRKIDCCAETGCGCCVGVNHKGASRGFNIRGRRLLFVDDNPAQLASFSEQFQAWGLDAVPCNTPAEAMSLLRENIETEKRFELLIVNGTVAGGRGGELVREAKTLPPDHRPKIIYFASLMHREDDDEVRNSGTICITKPVFPSTLFEKIINVLFENVDFDGVSVVRGELSSQDNRREKSSLAGKIRILVAEDNRVNQIVAKNLLEEAGFDCSIASNGVEACAEARKGGFDLILMDCQMPEMDGYEATDQIRKWELEHGKKRIPIIALTANATKEDEQKCLSVGMDAFCVKPINPANVVRIIEEMCRNSV